MTSPITEFKDVCEKLSQDMMKPFTVQKENIYIDSDLLFDYRLGAVLARVNGESDYNHVVQNIPAYLKAPTLECAKFFPQLNLTEEDLDDVIANPEYFMFLNAAAPATKLIADLEPIIRLFNTINESREGTNPIRITVNQRQIKFCKLVKANLLKTIHKIDPKVVVEFTEYKSWFEVPTSLIESQDFICVYNMIEFLKEGTNSQKLMAAVPPRLSKTNIATLLQSDVANPTVDHFHNLRVMLEVMCHQFCFRPKTLLNEELING